MLCFNFNINIALLSFFSKFNYSVYLVVLSASGVTLQFILEVLKRLECYPKHDLLCVLCLFEQTGVHHEICLC